MAEFTHIDDQGRVRMVDVSDKSSTMRVAVARGKITMNRETLANIRSGGVKKGNVLETARIAGIMAAKRTWELIPMCHPIAITHAQVDFAADDESNSIEIHSEVRTVGPTGVEIEAMTAVAVAAVTIYDMCKSYDRGMVISEVRLVKKEGGKSGAFAAE
ncbi:MAG: cyclic pyranopterin monophosphate synthase MoaC [Thermodesulfobacteriota bacterium]